MSDVNVFISYSSSERRFDPGRVRRLLVEAVLAAGSRPRWLAPRFTPRASRDSVSEPLSLADVLVVALDGIADSDVSRIKHNLELASELKKPTLVFFSPSEGSTSSQSIQGYWHDLLSCSGASWHAFEDLEDLRRISAVSLKNLFLHRSKGGSLALPSETDPEETLSVLPPRTDAFVGRRHELDQLISWARSDDKPIAILHGHAGTGKSCLAAQFLWEASMSLGDRFKEHVWHRADHPGPLLRLVPDVGTPQIWHVDVDRSCQLLDFPAQLDRALERLDERRTLVVIDGYESLMNAYGSSSPAGSFRHVSNDLRCSSDPQSALLLRRLLNLRFSKVLITTRLFPADLEEADWKPNPGTLSLSIGPLRRQEALDLLSWYGVSESPAVLLKLLSLSSMQPLELRLLAGQCLSQENPDFDELDDIGAKILGESWLRVLARLGDNRIHLMRVATRLGATASYESIEGLCLRPQGPFRRPSELDRALADLEQRGLLSWNREKNSYSPPPAVTRFFSKWIPKEL